MRFYNFNCNLLDKQGSYANKARARIEQIFPKLTATQIRRITPHGRFRTAERGEVLYEQGDSAAPFFVVVRELEVLRPSK
jgi:hypothetical protein